MIQEECLETACPSLFVGTLTSTITAKIATYVTVANVQAFLSGLQRFFNPLSAFEPLKPVSVKTVPPALSAAITTFSTLDWTDASALKRAVDAAIFAAYATYNSAAVPIDPDFRENLIT